MKFKALFALMLALLMLLSSCQAKEVDDEKLPEETEKSNEKTIYADASKYLIEGDWSRYDDNIGEALNITFTEDGEYYYSCDCGEPVGNSDIYDSYSYDKESKTIILSCCDGEKDEIRIMYADDDYLMLSIEDEAHIFKNNNSKLNNAVHESAQQYVPEGESAVLTVLAYEDGIFTVAPYNYDHDARRSFKDRIYTLEADDDIYFHWAAVTVENDEEAYVEEYRLDKEDISHIGEYFTYGYLAIGEDGQVEQITFYGETWIYG